MSFDKGFNFRASAGFVTDGATETYVAGDAYPVTRNGVTFGWETGNSTVDRDNTVDPRFAGVNYTSNGDGSQIVFRVDLPATGQYDVRVAMGDTGAAQTRQAWELLDNATSLTSFDDADGTAQDHYDDATGADQTEAGWPGSNTAFRGTFATTILKIKVGSLVTDGGASTVAHLFVSQVSGGGSDTPLTPTVGAAAFAGIQARPVVGTVLTPATP